MNKKYKNLLKEFIKFKSVSTSDEFKSEIEKTVEWLERTFKSKGFKVKIIKGYDNPVVLAEYIQNKEYETALIYGHYDVQPASESEGWSSDPFKLTERSGRLYARGVVDNKGQVMIHIINIFNLIEKGKLKYNIKFFIEGNEETGSPNLEKCIKDKKKLLNCDFIMISDGEITSDYPVVEAGFRGGFNSTLKCITSDKDLHSGLYGGASPIASHELIKIINRIYKENGSIAINGFYDNVDDIGDEIREMNKNIPFDLDYYKKLSGTKALVTEDNNDFYTQTGLRPAVVVTGLDSGYTGEGYRNSIPSYATAKINFRLVKSQDPKMIVELFKKFIKKQVPNYVDYKLDIASPYYGIKLNLDNEYIKTARKHLKKAFGKEPLVKFCGGGLPIVTYFNDILSVPQILAPLANEDCGMHSVDENYNLKIVKKALDFSDSFWSKSF